MKQLDIIKIKRLDIDTITCELMTINDDLSDFYEQIDCSTIDIVLRRFNGRYFDIICDDEALLKDNPGLPTSILISDEAREGLYGTLLLCHHDSEGNLTDANADELLDIQFSRGYALDEEGNKIMLLTHTL